MVKVASELWKGIVGEEYENRRSSEREGADPTYVLEEKEGGRDERRPGVSVEDDDQLEKSRSTYSGMESID